MREDVRLVLATETDAELIHQMKYEAFLPLYEKYQDDETSPAKEGMKSISKEEEKDCSASYGFRYSIEKVTSSYSFSLN